MRIAVLSDVHANLAALEAVASDLPTVDGVWVLGDIVEESGPPMYGSGSFPFGWPEALRELLERIGPTDRLIPGHGAVVDRGFVVAQLESLQTVADAIRSAHARGLAIEDALGSASVVLPWPETVTRSAFEQGYAQLNAT
jgi:glyoxylase-like metal-dependent hydrolase (beta-lactamase superfamily II)